MTAADFIEKWLRRKGDFRNVYQIVRGTGYAKSTVQSCLRELRQNRGLEKIRQDGTNYYGFR